MSAKQNGAMALLKRLRGSSKKPGEQSSGAKQMAMLKRLPKILRFIPGTAQDVRAYFLTLQYWLSGSDDNVANMVRYLVSRYASGPRENLRAAVKADMPADLSRGRHLPPRSANPRDRYRCWPANTAKGARHGGAHPHALLPAGRQHCPL
jgi:magnesium chelatase subunit H